MAKAQIPAFRVGVTLSIKIVSRQSEFAFFGALTSVGALFILEGKIKSLFRPRNKKIALKKYDEFIRFKEKEYMAAIKETSARVEEIIGDRKVFYDDLKELANSITIKVKEKATDDE